MSFATGWRRLPPHTPFLAYFRRSIDYEGSVKCRLLKPHESMRLSTRAELPVLHTRLAKWFT